MVVCVLFSALSGLLLIVEQVNKDLLILDHTDSAALTFKTDYLFCPV